MLRSGFQAGKPQAVHQIVDSEKRILDTELLLEDTLHILAAKDTHAIIDFGRTGQDTLSQMGFFLSDKIAPIGWGVFVDKNALPAAF